MTRQHVRRAVAFLSTTTLVGVLTACSAPTTPARPEAPMALLGTAGSSSTSRADLDRTIAWMEARVARNAGDTSAAVTLADALLRQTRITGNAGLALRAEAVLTAALKADPISFNARRMLGAVYLSQHRFRDAIREAEQCRATHPNDAWLHGVLGDAHLELGEYPEAFAAFDRMAALRPNAAAYARASYARELQGDLEGAIRIMRMAADATSPSDPESLAWHHAQLGHLALERGRLADARREYEHADYVFPGHPFASDGLARLMAAEGDYAGALRLAMARIAAAPTPADAAFAGDMLAALGRNDEAEQEYRLAEAAWTTDAPEPARLARFLAAHGRQTARAVQIAEQAAADRRDIFTQDALAWAYFQAGQLDQARAAAALALRTGSRDREIRAHAAAIEQAAATQARR